MPIPNSLTEIPEVPMENILDHCGFPSILALRKTCHYFRNLIDDTKPASHLTEIDVFVNPESISFDLYFPSSPSSIRVDYLKNGEGCLVKCKKEGNAKETMMENADFVTVFFKEFDIILRHQKTELEKFEISFDSLDSEFKEKVLESLNKSLKSLNKPLQVKSLYMGVNDHTEIMSILPYVDPKPLELIDIDDYLRRFSNVLNLDEIGQLEQWKQATELEIRGFQISDISQNFKHFSRIVLVFQEVSIEELILLKEIFLCSSTLNTMEIYFNLDYLGDIIERLIEAFGEDIFETIKRINWFFRIPDTNQFLSVQFTDEAHDCIVFNRIEQSDVPQNAIISN